MVRVHVQDQVNGSGQELISFTMLFKINIILTLICRKKLKTKILNTSDGWIDRYVYQIVQSSKVKWK